MSYHSCKGQELKRNINNSARSVLSMPSGKHYTVVRLGGVLFPRIWWKILLKQAPFGNVDSFGLYSKSITAKLPQLLNYVIYATPPVKTPRSNRSSRPIEPHVLRLAASIPSTFKPNIPSPKHYAPRNLQPNRHSLWSSTSLQRTIKRSLNKKNQEQESKHNSRQLQFPSPTPLRAKNSFKLRT